MTASGPDCEGCEAPCCRSFYVWGAESGKPCAPQAMKEWSDAGATLVPIAFEDGGWTRFNCSALAGTRCSVYDVRPDSCRTYDCREDREQTPAHCVWPMEGRK